MADKDILQAIRIIDDKIASLQEARDRLANAFGISGSPDGSAPVPISTRSRRDNPDSEQHLQGHFAPKGRKEQLAEFLLQNGPTSRVSIVEKSGLPEGTISYCLGDKRFFEQNVDGDWTITEFSRRGLERKKQSPLAEES